MKKHALIYFLLLLYHSCPLFSHSENDSYPAIESLSIEGGDEQANPLVVAVTKIPLDSCPGAFNPSLFRTDQGIVLTFRYCPDRLMQWISYIGLVLLDENLQPISEPELLNTTPENSSIPSQAEDARIFSYKGDLHVIFTGNRDTLNPTAQQRRDMFIAKMSYVDGHFTLAKPLKLYHQQMYFRRTWQKNWTPFEWNDRLFMIYTINPHEILSINPLSGECLPLFRTFSPIGWSWGELRGGTPAMLIDDEYLAFFHSSIFMSSPASNNVSMYHYYMGAYNFAAEPPFKITKMTTSPIMHKDFHTQSFCEKRVVFPGGYIVSGPYFQVAYGKDDHEVWIATIDREELKKALKPTTEPSDFNHEIQKH